MNPHAERHHHGMGDKLCALTCCPCQINVAEIIPLVDKPKYICENCGHVANDRRNLCDPVEMKIAWSVETEESRPAGE